MLCWRLAVRTVELFLQLYSVHAVEKVEQKFTLRSRGWNNSFTTASYSQHGLQHVHFFQLICSQHAAALTIFFQILVTQTRLLLCALKKRVKVKPVGKIRSKAKKHHHQRTVLSIRASFTFFWASAVEPKHPYSLGINFFIIMLFLQCFLCHVSIHWPWDVKIHKRNSKSFFWVFLCL